MHMLFSGLKEEVSAAIGLLCGMAAVAKKELERILEKKMKIYCFRKKTRTILFPNMKPEYLDYEFLACESLDTYWPNINENSLAYYKQLFSSINTIESSLYTFFYKKKF